MDIEINVKMTVKGVTTKDCMKILITESLGKKCEISDVFVNSVQK